MSGRRRTWAALAAGAAVLAVLLVLLWRGTLGDASSPEAPAPEPTAPVAPGPAPPSPITRTAPPSLDEVPPALETALETDDPEAACEEVSALVAELPRDDFAHTVAESYGYPVPDAPFLWIPLGDVGVAVPAADYTVTVTATVRVRPGAAGEPWPGVGLRSEDAGITVLFTPGVENLAMGLPGFGPDATALDVYRAALHVTPESWRCDPGDLVGSTRDATALIVKRLLSPTGVGPGRAFLDVGVDGSVLSLRDDGERVALSHSLAAGGAAWQVQVLAADDEVALTALGLAQLTGTEPPGGAAALPGDVAEAAAILGGDWAALERWLQRHPVGDFAERRLRGVLDHHVPE